MVRPKLHSSVAPSGASLSPEGNWPGRLLPKRHVFQGPNQKKSSFPDSSWPVEDPPSSKIVALWHKDLDLQLRIRKSNCFWYKVLTSFLPNEPGKLLLLLFAINGVNFEPVCFVLVGSTVSLCLMHKIIILNFLCLFWWLTHHFFVSCISSNQSCCKRIASILLRGLRGNRRTVCFVSVLYILQKWNSGQK